MLFAARLLLLFAVALATVGAARGDDLAQFMDRMRAHSGPVWRTHLTSSSRITLGRDRQLQRGHWKSADVTRKQIPTGNQIPLLPLA